jgi:SnoaL-like domain
MGGEIHLLGEYLEAWFAVGVGVECVLSALKDDFPVRWVKSLRKRVALARCVLAFSPLRNRQNGQNVFAMAITINTQTGIAFVAGFIVAVLALIGWCSWQAPANGSATKVASYQARLSKVETAAPRSKQAVEAAGIERFKSFLQGIGDANFVRKNTLTTYAADAYLDDTLAVHHGAAEIEAYFVKTSETMTSYRITIDDVAQSDKDYYVRWTMIFAAPALSGGKPIHSIGVSQVRFNREGKVEFHQDFWDAGRNFYEHLPIVGGVIGYVHKRLESN